MPLRKKKDPVDKPKTIFDLTLLPGTKREQKDQASDMLIRGQKPIVIEKVSGGYALRVIGTVIGVAPTKDMACSAAHSVGHYRLELGDFVSTYVDGYCKR